MSTNNKRQALSMKDRAFLIRDDMKEKIIEVVPRPRIQGIRIGTDYLGHQFGGDGQAPAGTTTPRRIVDLKNFRPMPQDPYETLLNAYVKWVKPVENAARKGYDQNTQRWAPHASAEKGSDTIGYGLKLSENPEVAALVKQRGYITDQEAELYLKKAVKKAINSAAETYNASYANVNFAGLHPFLQMILVDKAFNTGSVKGWPKLMRAIDAGDYQGMLKEYETKMRDPKTGELVKLGERNKHTLKLINDFYNSKQQNWNALRSSFHDYQPGESSQIMVSPADMKEVGYKFSGETDVYGNTVDNAGIATEEDIDNAGLALFTPRDEFGNILTRGKEFRQSRKEKALELLNSETDELIDWYLPRAHKNNRGLQRVYNRLERQKERQSRREKVDSGNQNNVIGTRDDVTNLNYYADALRQGKIDVNSIPEKYAPALAKSREEAQQRALTQQQQMEEYQNWYKNSGWGTLEKVYGIGMSSLLASGPLFTEILPSASGELAHILWELGKEGLRQFGKKEAMKAALKLGEKTLRQKAAEAGASMIGSLIAGEAVNEASKQGGRYQGWADYLHRGVFGAEQSPGQVGTFLYDLLNPGAAIGSYAKSIVNGITNFADDIGRAAKSAWSTVAKKTNNQVVGRLETQSGPQKIFNIASQEEKNALSILNSQADAESVYSNVLNSSDADAINAYIKKNYKHLPMQAQKNNNGKIELVFDKPIDVNSSPLDAEITLHNGKKFSSEQASKRVVKAVIDKESPNSLRPVVEPKSDVLYSNKAVSRPAAKVQKATQQTVSELYNHLGLDETHAKLSGSSSLSIHGYSPQVPADVDLIVTESTHNAKIAGKLALSEKAKTNPFGYTYEFTTKGGKTVDVDVTIVKNRTYTLPDGTTKVLADYRDPMVQQLFLQQYPEEYYRQMSQIADGKISRLHIPYTAEELVAGITPEDKIIDAGMAAFNPAKEKHAARFMMYLEQVDPQVMETVTTRLGKIRFGQGYKPLDVSKFNLNDVDANLRFLSDINFQAENFKEIAKNPARMKTIIEDYNQYASALTRGESNTVLSAADWERRATQFTGEGGTALGIGKNYYINPDKSYGPDFSRRQVDMNYYLTHANITTLDEYTAFVKGLQGQGTFPEIVQSELSNVLSSKAGRKVSITNVHDLEKFVTSIPLAEQQKLYEQIKTSIPYIEHNQYRGGFSPNQGGVHWHTVAGDQPSVVLENAVARYSNYDPKEMQLLMSVVKGKFGRRNYRPTKQQLRKIEEAEYIIRRAQSRVERAQKELSRIEKISQQNHVRSSEGDAGIYILYNMLSRILGHTSDEIAGVVAE